MIIVSPSIEVRLNATFVHKEENTKRKINNKIPLILEKQNNKQTEAHFLVYKYDKHTSQTCFTDNTFNGRINFFVQFFVVVFYLLFVNIQKAIDLVRLEF